MNKDRLKQELIISLTVSKITNMKMKFLFPVIGFLCFFGCTKDGLIEKCLPLDLQSGVIAFYPFNSGGLTDESGNNNDLSNSTTAFSTSDRDGNPDCAFQFDATNDEFLTTTQTDFLNNLSEFSVSVWYQPMDSTRNGGSFEVLLGRGDESRCPNRRGEWSVGLYDCRRAVFGHNNSVWANPFGGAGSCQDLVESLTGIWHHLVVVKNNDLYEIYFNGVLEDSDSGNAGCTNLHIAEDIGDLFIGKFYTGKIDDILIYNRALDAQEVSDLFELEPCCD